jgi:hypothetical protein
MNQLYEPQYIMEVTINNGKEIETLKYLSDGYYVKYGEPNSDIKEVNNWNDLIEYLGYEEGFYGHKDRKGLFLRVDYTDKNYYRCQKKVYEHQFISAKSYFKNKIINQKDIKMKRLVNELNADEFILYLKDNGIGELPIQ